MHEEPPQRSGSLFSVLLFPTTFTQAHAYHALPLTFTPYSSTSLSHTENTQKMQRKRSRKWERCLLFLCDLTLPCSAALLLTVTHTEEKNCHWVGRGMPRAAARQSEDANQQRKFWLLFIMTQGRDTCFQISSVIGREWCKGKKSIHVFMQSRDRKHAYLPRHSKIIIQS